MNNLLTQLETLQVTAPNDGVAIILTAGIAEIVRLRDSLKRIEDIALNESYTPAHKWGRAFAIATHTLHGLTQPT